MTSNQISYWANKEKERNNRKLEEINEYTAQENARHNKAYEEETKRHNEETEKYGYSTLAETNRHNLAIESISAQEAETKRIQQIAQNQYWEAMAEVSAREAAATERNADINAINAVTRAQEVQNNYVLGLMNAETAQKNASTARYQAQTEELRRLNSERETDLKVRMSNYEIEDLQSQQQRRKVQNVTDVIDSVSGLLRVGKDFVSGLGTRLQYSLFN